MTLHFLFWLFCWSNLGLKYAGLGVADLELHGMAEGVSMEALAQDAADALLSPNLLLRGRSKLALQARHTSRALGQLARRET